jgi:geranylgeranyl diphosphate synthase type II
MDKSFKDELTARVQQIESIIQNYLPEEGGYAGTVISAMNYAVHAGGKRLRPMLMQETYRLFNSDTDNAVLHRFMAAIEMIHTYSLVHDDLPALDNDDYRRGRKTTHIVYGEDMAILAGDGLLNYAFEVAAESFSQNLIPAERVGKAMQVLTRKPGISGMIGGQTLDVELTGRQMNLEQLMYIHENKTGALIECAMMIGAILAGASDEQVAAIEKIASNIGIAFQIQDDILDIIADEATLGKPVRSDEKNEKITYVTLKGLEQSAKDVERLSKLAVEQLGLFGDKNKFLIQLVEYLIHRDK